MPYFDNEAEVYKYLGGIFRLAGEHPNVGPKLRSANTVVRYDFTDPDATITAVLSPDGIKIIEGATGSDVTPELTIGMSADDGDKFWRGKLNAAMAMARGTVKVQGAPAKFMKLIPAVKAAYPLYADLVAEKDACA